MKLVPFLPFAFIYSFFYYIFNVSKYRSIFFKKRSLFFYIKNYLNIFRNTILSFPEIKGKIRISLSEDFLKIGGKESLIMVTLHFGIWEYLPSIFSKLGYKTAIFVSNYRSKLYKRIVDLIRTDMGVSFYRNINNIKQGSLIGFTLDNIGRKTITTKGIRFSKIPFILSRRYDIPVIPIVGWRDDGYFVVETGNFVDSVEEVVKWFMKRVLKKPEQYVWVGK